MLNIFFFLNYAAKISNEVKHAQPITELLTEVKKKLEDIDLYSKLSRLVLEKFSLFQYVFKC